MAAVFFLCVCLDKDRTFHADETQYNKLWYNDKGTGYKEESFEFHLDWPIAMKYSIHQSFHLALVLHSQLVWEIVSQVGCVEQAYPYENKFVLTWQPVRTSQPQSKVYNQCVSMASVIDIRALG